MNPHSTRSQFNQRLPKAGPAYQASRFMDIPSAAKLGLSPNHSQSKSHSKTSSVDHRRIATNSRVKSDDRMRTEMFLSYINNAFQEKSKGNPAAFNDLINQFSPQKSTEEPMQYSQLRYWIAALSHVVSRLDRPHAILVESLVNMPWTVMDTATVKSYITFMGVLVSARPEYLTMVLAKIAHGLTHQSGLQALNSSFPESSSTPLRRRDIYDRQHWLLQHLLSLIPTLPSTLIPFLIKNFPHKRQKEMAQTTYIRNILRVVSYCPELSDRILETIVDRAIQIDVEIQADLEELENDMAMQEQDLFELDPFDSVVGKDESSDSESDSDDEFDDNLSDLSSTAGDMEDQVEEKDVPMDVQLVQETVQKLDAILALLFEHFDKTSAALHDHDGSSSLSSLQDLPPLPPLLSSPIAPFNAYIPSSQPRSPLGSPFVAPVQTLPPLTPSELTLPQPPSVAIQRRLARSQFHALLAIFDRTIIKTFKSRYTQFLLFWYTSLDPEYADVFQGMLVNKALFESSMPAVTRASAASYIGSFVSRANFVDHDAARRVTSILCDFIRSHLDFVEASELKEPNGRQSSSSSVLRSSFNTVFYSVCQAFFLIFCFRWRDLMEESDDDDFFQQASSIAASGSKNKWMKELGVINRAVHSKLNPLRACATSVSGQFARVALATNFVYCYNVLDSNKRSEGQPRDELALPKTMSSKPANGVLYIPGDDADYEMTAFFPFDPYKLPKSQAFIHGLYRTWDSVAIEDEDDDEDEGRDEDEDAVERNEEHRHLSVPRPQQRGEDQTLNASLGAMSISPSHPLAQGLSMSVTLPVS